MDASTILMAAGAVLGTTAVEETTKRAVTELWGTLKSLVTRQRGAHSQAIVVLDEVACQPADSRVSPELSARVDALRLSDDPSIAALLQEFESLLRQRAPAVIEKQYNFNGGNFNNITFN